MTDNVVPFTKPIVRLPPRWRQHADALAQMEKEIDALRERLEAEKRAFHAVIYEDMDACARKHLKKPTPDWAAPPAEYNAMKSAAHHLVKNAEDALVLLECAKERIGYATPGDYDFEFAPKSEPAA